MSVDPTQLPISGATIQRVRQLMKSDLRRASDTFSTDTDPRYQPASPNIAENVRLSGILLGSPIIAAGVANVTSTGVTGPYNVSFGATFATSPAVVAWNTVDPVTGGIVCVNIQAITSVLMQIVMAEEPTNVAVPAGRVIGVHWIAIGA